MADYPFIDESPSFSQTCFDFRRGRSKSKQQQRVGRTHSADSRPQYKGRSSSSKTRRGPVLFPSQLQSRASVAQTPAFPNAGLPQFEGIYQDLEEGWSRGRSMSPIRQSNSMDPAAHRVLLSQQQRVKQYPYHHQSSQTQQQQQLPGNQNYDDLKESLIMFGDAYADQNSMSTGLSQQELIKKKRRDQTTKRRKEKKFGKKKKKDRIVNLPLSLLTGRRNQDKKQKQQSGTRKYVQSAESSSDNGSFPAQSHQHSLPEHETKKEQPQRKPAPAIRRNVVPSQPRSLLDDFASPSVSHSSDGLISAATSSQASEDLKPSQEVWLEPQLTEDTPVTLTKDVTDHSDDYDDMGAAAVQKPEDTGFPLLSTNSSESFDRRESEDSQQQTPTNDEQNEEGENEDENNKTVSAVNHVQWAQSTSSKTYNKEEPPATNNSPTSVIGIDGNEISTNEPPHIRQLPKPRSILRKRRSRSDQSDVHSDTSPPYVSQQRSTRRIAIQEQSTIVFMDGSGHELSPICQPSQERLISQFQDQGSVSLPSIESTVTSAMESVQTPVTSDGRDSLSNRDDDSALVSETYVDFFEAVATVVIQTAVRQFLAKMKVSAMRHQMLHAKTEDSFANSDSQEDSEVVTKKAQHIAAIVIQTTFRGWWVRDSIKVDHYCATLIQKNFRAFYTRMDFRFDLFRIVTSQSAVRKWLAIRDASCRLHGIVTLQRVFRGYRIRKRRKQFEYAHQERVKKITAAITLQTIWRSFVCEMKYLRTYEDVVIVQSIVRGWITRKLLRSWLQAHKIHALGRVLGSQKEHRMHPSRAAPSPVKKPDVREVIDPMKTTSNNSKAGKRGASSTTKALSASYLSAPPSLGNSILGINGYVKSSSQIPATSVSNMTNNVKRDITNKSPAVERALDITRKYSSDSSFSCHSESEFQNNFGTTSKSSNTITKDAPSISRVPSDESGRRRKDLANRVTRTKQEKCHAVVHAEALLAASFSSSSSSVSSSPSKKVGISSQQPVDRAEQLRKERIAYYTNREKISKPTGDRRLYKGNGAQSPSCSIHSTETAVISNGKSSFERAIIAMKHQDKTIRQNSTMSLTTISRSHSEQESNSDLEHKYRDFPPRANSSSNQSTIDAKPIPFGGRRPREDNTEGANRVEMDSNVRNPPTKNVAARAVVDLSVLRSNDNDISRGVKPTITPASTTEEIKAVQSHDDDGDASQTESVSYASTNSTTSELSEQGYRVPSTPTQKLNRKGCHPVRVRSEAEQRRIDKIHETFRRVGLMSRKPKSMVGASSNNDGLANTAVVKQNNEPTKESPKNDPIENISSSQYSGRTLPIFNDDDPGSATDLIRAWRKRDTSNPTTNAY